MVGVNGNAFIIPIRSAARSKIALTNCVFRSASGPNQRVPVVEADLAPGFEQITALGEFFAGEKFQLGDGGFVGGDVFGFQIEDVNDAEVNFADFVGIIVQQGHDPLRMFAADFEFLVHFAFHTGVVGIAFQRGLFGVFGVNVATDAQAPLGGEALFAALFAADVMQQFPPAMEQRVRDDLLVGRIVFSVVPEEEKVVFRVQEAGQIMVHVGGQSLKGTQLIKEGATDDKNTFVVIRHGAA